MLVRQTLQTLCQKTDWCYGVFWKLKRRRTRSILTWEDGFYDHTKPSALPPSGNPSLYGHFEHPIWLSVSKMSYHVYSLGEGVIGSVAFTNKHKWFFSGSEKAASDDGTNSETPQSTQLKSEKYPAGWENQFAVGIKTILVIAVPQGVVQLGSMQTINEDFNLIEHVKATFGALQSIPGAFFSDLVQQVQNSNIPGQYPMLIPWSVFAPVVPAPLNVYGVTNGAGLGQTLTDISPSATNNSNLVKPCLLPRPQQMSINTAQMANNYRKTEVCQPLPNPVFCSNALTNDQEQKSRPPPRTGIISRFSLTTKPRNVGHNGALPIQNINGKDENGSKEESSLSHSQNKQWLQSEKGLSLSVPIAESLISPGYYPFGKSGAVQDPFTNTRSEIKNSFRINMKLSNKEDGKSQGRETLSEVMDIDLGKTIATPSIFAEPFSKGYLHSRKFTETSCSSPAMQEKAQFAGSASFNGSNHVYLPQFGTDHCVSSSSSSCQSKFAGSVSFNGSNHVYIPQVGTDHCVSSSSSSCQSIDHVNTFQVSTHNLNNIDQTASINIENSLNLLPPKKIHEVDKESTTSLALEGGYKLDSRGLDPEMMDSKSKASCSLSHISTHAHYNENMKDLVDVVPIGNKILCDNNTSTLLFETGCGDLEADMPGFPNDADGDIFFNNVLEDFEEYYASLLSMENGSGEDQQLVVWDKQPEPISMRTSRITSERENAEISRQKLVQIPNLDANEKEIQVSDFNGLGSELKSAGFDLHHSNQRMLPEAFLSCDKVRVIDRESVQHVDLELPHMLGASRMKALNDGLQKNNNIWLTHWLAQGASEHASKVSDSSMKTLSDYKNDYVSFSVNNEENPTQLSREKAIQYMGEKLPSTVFYSNNEKDNASKKRCRIGESSSRSRPKDKQRIQDSVQELQEIVPNSSKCNIDGLLEKTATYVNFLETFRQPVEEQIQSNDLEANNMNDCISLTQGSTSWSVDLRRAQGMDCPIIIENLNKPQQMLLEMVCEERGIFLEIEESIKGLGLIILTRVMEVKDNKILAHFVVEGGCKEVCQSAIIQSLMPLLDPTKSFKQGYT